RGDVAVAILDDAHHHQAGDDEVHVGDAVHGADPRADQPAEDQEVQRHGDRRRHEGLGPDAQDSADLAARDGAQRDQVGVAHARASGNVAVAGSPAATMRTNSSSSRLLLVLMDRTRMPASPSAANTRLRSIARGISMSSVWSSRASTVVPSISGSTAGSAPSMSSTNPSTSSRASRVFIGPAATIVPRSMIARLRHRYSASSR